MRQPSLSVLIASILLSVVISEVIALLIAVIPIPSCCWLVSTFLSRNLIISITAAEISIFNFGACSNVQLLGMRYCFKILSLFSLAIPFLSSGCHSWVKLLWMSSPHAGPCSVASPRADKTSGSNGGKLESSETWTDSTGASGGASGVVGLFCGIGSGSKLISGRSSSGP